MSQLIAFVPIVAALVCATLAGGAMFGRPPLTRRRVAFALLNASVAMWTLGHALARFMSPGLVSSMAGYSSVLYLAWAIQAVGFSFAAANWLLFAATVSGNERVMAGWRLFAWYLPGVYGIAVMLSNPSHMLYETVADGAARYGVLAVPFQAYSYLLVAYGTYLIITSSWRKGTQDGRRQTFAFGATAIVLVVAALAWDLRQHIGFSLEFNPVPPLLAMLSAVLAYETLSGGFEDLLPLARMEAFEAMADAALVVDPQMRIAAINPAASRVFPRATEGDRLDELHSGIAKHVYACLHHGASDLMFETAIGKAIYWGRVRRADSEDPAKGCVVLLTDLTELREAQARAADQAASVRLRRG